MSALTFTSVSKREHGKCCEIEGCRRFARVRACFLNEPVMFLCPICQTDFLECYEGLYEHETQLVLA